MKIDLTRKEAHLLMAMLWELGQERCTVIGGMDPMWRVTDKGADILSRIISKLEDANEEAENKRGTDRDLSGAPKGSIQDARWVS